MKKINLAVILSVIMVFISSAYAEGDSLTEQNIQGSWKLEYTTKSEKSEERSKRKDTWVFKDNGTVVIKNIPREGGYYDQLPVKFEIEGNQLKIAILGRTGRFDKFTLVSKDGKHMALKAKFGDIYHFSKK